MPNDPFLERDLARLTHAELLDVAERQRARLQDFDLEGREGKAAPSDRTGPHPASPDIDGELLFGGGGKFLGYRGTGRDLTQVLAEDETHRTLFDAMARLPVGVMLWDAEDRLLFKNFKVETMLAPGPIAEVGEKFEAAIRRVVNSGAYPPAIGREEAFIQERLEKHRRSGEPFEYQVGGYWLEVTNYVLGGGMVMTLFQDQTERNRKLALLDAHAEIRGILESVTDGVAAYDPDGTIRSFSESAERLGDRLRAVFDSLHDGLLVADKAGNIVDVNPVTIRMFGYDRKELIGANIAIIMSDEMGREHDGSLADYLKAGKEDIIGKSRKLTGRRKNGQEFPLHLHVTEFERGGQKYFVGSTLDLTETEQMESRQRQFDKLAAVGRLAGGIAHDFNNLLLPIITLTEIMLDDQASEEKRIERHKVVLAAAERGRRIVEKFLAFSREDSLITEAVDLPAMVEEVLGLVRDSALATISFQSSAQSA